MSTIILYTKYCRFVGRELARLLDIYGYYNPPASVLKKATKVIRWGYYEDIGRNVPQINSRDSILAASAKMSSLKTLENAGLTVPKIMKGCAFPCDKIIFGRSYNHTGGKDIEIIHPGKMPKLPHDFYSEYREPHREWRVHVFGGKVIFAQRKFFLEGEPKGNEQYVRAYDNGWRFHRLRNTGNLPTSVAAASIKAIKTLGLTFGAVDAISYGRDENNRRKAMILEINTAPGLDEGLGLDLYVEKFKEWIG